MGIWIRAICTKPLGTLADIDLRGPLAAEDLEAFAAGADLDEEAGTAAREALRLVYSPERPDVGELHYGEDREITFERWAGAEAREELDEMLENLEDEEGDGIDRVRDVLERAVETVAFELRVSHSKDMGWPLALCAAMELAKRGDGLVQGDTDGDTWWDPQTGEVVTEY